MTQLALQFDEFAAQEPRKPAIPGAFDAYVAPLPGQPEPEGPRPVLARDLRECEQIAGNIAGVPAERVLCLPARNWDDELMSMLEAANRRADNELHELRKMHARILGCSVDELDARVAERKAEEKRQMDEIRAQRPARVKAKTSKSDVIGIGLRALNDRQRELLNLVRVEDNFAVYTQEDFIPDWDELKRVMVALGGTWSRKTKKRPGGFAFADDVDAREAVRLALETGEILDARAAEFFETSDALADELAAFVDPQPGDIVLEPSAGKGALVFAIRRRCPGAQFVCVEPFVENAEHLEQQGNVRVIQADFLTLTESAIGRVDHCIMNPPFGKRADVRHILHALSLLPVGGRLAAIASAGVAYRDDKLGREFRDVIERNNGRIVENPEGSFAHVGTNVRTVSIFATRSA